MRALHRMVVAGAVGSLATAAFAASGAFACTPLADVRISAAGPSPHAPATVRPGDQVEVHFDHYYTSAAGSYGEVQIKWRDAAGVETLVDEVPGPAGTTAQTIPANAVSGVTHYFIAEQYKGGQRTARESVDVVVWTGTATPAPTPPFEPIPTDPQQPAAPPVDNGPAPTETPTRPGAPPAATPAPQSTPQPGTPRANTPAPSAAPGTAGAPVLPGQPATEAAGPLAATPAADPSSQAALPPADEPASGGFVPVTPNDLWSGVERGTSLVDPSAPPPSDDTSPAGTLLLVAGGLALAGAAASVGRRRVALARASR